jgi:hypothetical protein
MPTNNEKATVPLPTDFAHEEASRLALIERAMGINTKGHDVLDAEGRVVTTASELKKHEEATPEFLNVHSSDVTKYLIHLFGLVCVYILDVLLFGGTAEYVVSLITGNPILVFIGKYGIPLAFLGIEVLCALKMTEARKSSEEEVPQYGW